MDPAFFEQMMPFFLNSPHGAEALGVLLNAQAAATPAAARPPATNRRTIAKKKKTSRKSK